jgi:hypothetical protein
MIFLVVYSRTTQVLQQFRSYPDSNEEQAQADRLDAELNARPSDHIEALLLRAEDEQAVKNSHSRYFRDASTLLSELRHSA